MRAIALLETTLEKTGTEHDRPDVLTLLARAIVVYLLAGEPRRRSGAPERNADRVLALARRGARAAEVIGDVRLRANTRYAEALVLVGYRDLAEGIAAYREALQLAPTPATQLVSSRFLWIWRIIWGA